MTKKDKELRGAAQQEVVALVCKDVRENLLPELVECATRPSPGGLEETLEQVRIQLESELKRTGLWPIRVTCTQSVSGGERPYQAYIILGKQGGRFYETYAQLQPGRSWSTPGLDTGTSSGKPYFVEQPKSFHELVVEGGRVAGDHYVKRLLYSNEQAYDKMIEHQQKKKQRAKQQDTTYECAVFDPFLIWPQLQLTVTHNRNGEKLTCKADGSVLEPRQLLCLVLLLERRLAGELPVGALNLSAAKWDVRVGNLRTLGPLHKLRNSQESLPPPVVVGQAPPKETLEKHVLLAQL